MSGEFNTLLDATIEHLQSLKAQGTRFVDVQPETLQALAQPPAAPPRTASAPVSASSVEFSVPATTRPSPPVETTSAAVPPPVPVTVARTDTAAPAPADASLSPEAKAQAMAELRQRVMVCERCPNLVAARRNVVFGVGDIHARLMFVGEAPGADEDEQGEPFVGAAGQLLTRIIQTMGLSRETVYIANILKCRPDTPGQAYGNRKPTSAEMKTCLPYLEAQIDLIQPHVIVALGATAVEGLFGRPMSITRLRGQWQSYRDIPVMPTYHPAYLLRNQALSEKRKVWEDMLAVMTKLDMAISDKQQRYFLK